MTSHSSRSHNILRMVHGVEESNDVLLKWRIPLLCGLGGLFLLIVGWRVYGYKTGEKVEFIDSASLEAEIIQVDISGAIQKPDVYEIAAGARVQDLLEIAGGFSEEADQVWVARKINLAAKLIDGGKIYIPKVGEVGPPAGGVVKVEQGNTTEVLSETIAKDIVNINTASKDELEDLPGIGPVTAEKIIGNRPYQTIEELVTKKAVGQKTLDKIREQLSVY